MIRNGQQGLATRDPFRIFNVLNKDNDMSEFEVLIEKVAQRLAKN
jgi:hypothetical protein